MTDDPSCPNTVLGIASRGSMSLDLKTARDPTFKDRKAPVAVLPVRGVCGQRQLPSDHGGQIVEQTK